MAVLACWLLIPVLVDHSEDLSSGIICTMQGFLWLSDSGNWVGTLYCLGVKLVEINTQSKSAIFLLD